METTDPEPLPEPDLGPKRWPIHQRLIGAALRAAIGLLGVLPFWFWLVYESNGWRWSQLSALLVTGLCGFVLLAFEKRGARWWWVALRLSWAGGIIAVAAPVAVVWLDNLGDPVAAYRDLTRVLGSGQVFGWLLAVLAMGAYFTLLGVWIYVRNRTVALLPQVLAGTLTLLLPALLLLLNRPGRNLGWVFFLLSLGALVPLMTWLGDRVARRFDPEAPQPAGDGVRPTFAVAGVLVWVALSVPLGVALMNVGRSYNDTGTGQGEVVRSLQAIVSAQSTFSVNGTDAEGRPGKFAGSLPQLIQENDYSGPNLGVRTGYVYRLIRSRRDPTHSWAAAADPIRPGLGHYVVNQSGTVFRSEEPIRLDPETCALPPGLERATW